MKAMERGMDVKTRLSARQVAGLIVLLIIACMLPFVLGNSAFARVLMKINRGLVRLWPTMFGFQILLRARARPTLDQLLSDAHSAADQKLPSALQQIGNLRWLETESDQLVAYAKDDVVCVVNIDPYNEREGVCVVPVALGFPPAFDALDLIGGQEFTWRAGRNSVKLGPGKAHLIKITL